MKAGSLIARFGVACTLLIASVFLFALETQGDPKDPAVSPEDELLQVLEEKFAQQTFSDKGADTCMRCHDAESDMDATAIFFTSHGRQGVHAGPMQQAQCESCHGPDTNHSKARLRRGETREPMLNFGHNSMVPSEQQNQLCLNCHQQEHQDLWKGSEHDQADLSCASCHQVHVEFDPVQQRETQQQVCSSCHRDVKAQIHQRSTHPLKWGQMQCSDCHQSHGSMNDYLLTSITKNDNCFACHAEKRGPFLWEHTPVTEDCSNCHVAHGSINQALLKQRTPQLCQQCHSGNIHTSRLYTASQKSAFNSAKSCMNCHSKIHGSNHPSGHLFQR